MMIAVASFFTAISGVILVVTSYHGQKDFENAIIRSTIDKDSPLTNKEHLEEIKNVVSFKGIYQMSK